ncbi:MAG: ABC transporter substrate-binding protein [Proteobacteria bacterium]|nr:ABC transporter substrate-binding protein [Pseudomonadota bacterium]
MNTRQNDDKPRRNGTRASGRGGHPGALNLDLDSLEQMMNRRINIFLRHTGLVVTCGTLLLIGLIGMTIYFTTAPTTLKIAVGPKDGEDVKLVAALAEKFAEERAPFRLVPVISEGPVRIDEEAETPEFDLAVVASSPNMSADWPAVAILRQNVMVLMVPAPSARDAKKGKRPKIETVADLAGTRVGLVARSEATRELLKIVLDHYKVPLEKVQTVVIEPDNIAVAIRENVIDALLVSGPATGQGLATAVTAASNGKKGPSFIAIDHAEAIAARVPAYNSVEISAGTFSGSPASPGEQLTTLQFPQYVVASKTLSDNKMAAFSKLLYASRQTLSHTMPGLVKMESPSTDKDSTVLVHPGTDAYLSDSQKTFFEKFGDQIFYGLLIIPFVGSALAGVAGYFRADKSSRRLRMLHRLLQVVKKARHADSMEMLDQLQNDADNILSAVIQEVEREQIDELAMMSFSLAIEQARFAILERRALLTPRIVGPPPLVSLARPEGERAQPTVA